MSMSLLRGPALVLRLLIADSVNFFALARKAGILSPNPVLRSCCFVADEYRLQIRYSLRRRPPIPGAAALLIAAGLALDAKAVLRPRRHCGGHHPRRRDQSGGGVAAWARQGQPHRQRALCAGQRRPRDQESRGP